MANILRQCWKGKVDLLIPKLGLILNTINSCRSLTSKIVRLGLADDKFLYGNYMGQDRLFSYPFSYLVPKASPLKVSGLWFKDLN